ncbi:MAG: hypothetical protein CL912_16795 [Deltaproteobacteria bacterium]|nr:hypothetical protein [Deltaproteobacteria bacterium]
MAWPEGRDEVVGVNSFGVGGSNAHVSKFGDTSQDPA